MSRALDARSTALKTLQALRLRDAYAEAALEGLFARHPELDARERALASQLVYGVLRWRNRLDSHLARASSRPLHKLHPKVLDLLRVGAYQLLFLDRVPAHAAVSEAVALARAVGLAHAAGFVNAVLRRVAEAGREPELPEDPRGRLALLFGCPAWLVEAWWREHGQEGAERLCRAASRVPTLTLRVDPARLSRDRAVAELHAEGLEAGPCAWAPEGLWVEGAGNPRGLGPVSRGLAVVQDQASQLVAHLLAPRPGWRVLDGCAAPGLKATHLAQLMGDRGEVLALDVHPHRVRLVEELARSLGLSSVRSVQADSREYRGEGGFDAVLVDAPCSGLGVLARTPEAKWRRGLDDLASLPPLQLALLRNLAEAVRPGGVLVYATCTTLRAENEDVVEAFLGRRSDFAPATPPPGAVAWGDLLAPSGALRTFPAGVGEGRGEALDGFFGARLVRRGP